MLEKRPARDATRTTSGIRFTFSESKAAAAATVLLQDAGGRMPYLCLIKQLYLADRASIGELGRPIVGGRYVSMRYGPVLSEVLDLIGQGGDPAGPWAGAVHKDGYDLVVDSPANCGDLAAMEVDLLRRVANVHRELDRWKLAEMTHAFPEWKDPGNRAIPIAPEDILAALGKANEEIEEVRQAALERDHFARLFSQ